MADIKKCQNFLTTGDPVTAQKATKAIYARIEQLQKTPLIGRPYRKDAGLRELVISFGNAGYVALYQHNPDLDRILILAVRHQREAGY